MKNLELEVLRYIDEANRNPDNPEGYIAIEPGTAEWIFPFLKPAEDDAWRPARTLERELNRLRDLGCIAADVDHLGNWDNVRLTAAGLASLQALKDQTGVRRWLLSAKWLFEHAVMPVGLSIITAILTVLVMGWLGLAP